MRYLSTRGEIDPLSFSDAVIMGQARDGGLIVPEHIPDATQDIEHWLTLDYINLAVEIMKLFVDIPEGEMRNIVRRSYRSFSVPEVAPLHQIGPISILELFHGPTFAFKDLALQFLGNLFSHLLVDRGGELNVLTATSGDTGSAAIYGIRGRDNMRIFVMYPLGRISRSQEKQMTTVLDENVHSLAIKGTFDDCQYIMKAIFGDLKFRDRYSLGSANSINWARVLAQVVYYAFATLKILRSGMGSCVRMAVPTGNFGNIFAGYICAKMGIPIHKLILATNENDILSSFFNTGCYHCSSVHKTISPSMDIQVASNFERYLYYHTGENGNHVKSLMEKFSKERILKLKRNEIIDSMIIAGSGNTETTLATIKRYYLEFGYLMDPHTAVGVHVAEQNLVSGEPMICLATAHPAKFSEAIKQALGIDISRHSILKSLENQETRVTVLPASVQAVKEYIVNKIK